MNISGWIQLAFYVLVLLAITKPLGSSGSLTEFWE